MKHLLTILLFTLGITKAQGQGTTIKGLLTNEKGQPVKGIAVSLLQPDDSTLAFFGISNTQGYFEIVNASNGSYVLQAAGIGYRAYYSKIALPITGGNTLAPIVLHAISNALDSVKVSAQKVPIVFKGDTVEYNAGSFKTKPDAAVEELLKKMPGMEVDKDGNIKAHGKDVQKVLVDGKEFFGNDPKVATKNLPAESIDKVQVFDGLSDAAQFTGVDDGTREKTINLQMKNNKRKGYFGEVELGGGTNERYKASAKLYHFQKKSQFAILGMLNNVNQFGFTFQDYLTFKGGMQSLMDAGGGLQISGHSPINFGQPSSGLITSGAAGLNYTIEPKAGRRYNISYLGDGADKRLDQETYSQNFTGNETFSRNENSNERNKDIGHRLYASIRHDFDTTSQIRFNLNVAYANSNTSRQLLSSSAIRDIVMNKLDSHLEDAADGLNGDATLGWTKRWKGKWPVFRISATGGIDNALSKTYWDNITIYPATGIVVDDNQYQHNDKLKYRYSAGSTITRQIGSSNYLEVEMRAGYDYDRLNREQGVAGHEAPTDSLSLHFGRQYSWARPGLTFKYSTKKLQYNVALRAEEGWLHSTAEPILTNEREWTYLLPSGFVQYMPNNSVSANAQYSSSVTAPTARQMIPTTDYSNSIQRIHGSPLLSPENRHSLYLSWRKFDQFAFTSINGSLQGTYTKDKINFSRRINSDLSEDIYYTNVPSDYNISARGSYSTPIRKFGINISFSLGEQYTRGINSVNDIVNINSSFTHSGKLSISNRKQDTWGAQLAISGDVTDSRYSVQASLNSTFVHYNGYAELSYRSKHFYLSVTADADRYTSESFNDPVFVPLLKASATYYFLKGNRGVITLDGFDLLNQNKNIQRISQLNYLLEQRSNTIGRYAMLSFKYRLNYSGGKTGPGIDIKIDR